MSSLTEYILASQEQIRVEQFIRRADGAWTLRDYQHPDQELRVDSIGGAIPLARIYDGVAVTARS